MLPAWFVVFSIALRLGSGGRYAWGVVCGRAKPNPVTWFLWGLTPLITFFAGLPSGFNAQLLVVLVLGVSPIVIFSLAVMRQPIRPYLTPFALSCMAIAVLGIALWRATSDANLAISFSIIADMVAGFPTLLKAYKNPASEYPLPYFISTLSMVITMLTIRDWSFTTYAFPLYMMVSNAYLWAFAALPLRKMVRRATRRLSSVSGTPESD